MSELKTCTGCGESKPIDDFYKRTTRRGTHSDARCKQCDNARREQNARRRGELGQPTIPTWLTSDGLAQEECAARLGVTKRRVQQIESRAFFKMRTEAKRLGMEWP